MSEIVGKFMPLRLSIKIPCPCKPFVCFYLDDTCDVAVLSQRRHRLYRVDCAQNVYKSIYFVNVTNLTI